MTRPLAQVEAVLALYRGGVNKSRISRLTNIPRATVRDWVKAPPKPEGQPPKRVGCMRCDDRAELLTGEYVYLLGLYLGDGYLVCAPRDVWRLRIVQDKRYPGLVTLCQETMAAISGNSIGAIARIGYIEIYGNWKHWIHLFPQHAPGPKHARSIELQPWQAQLVEMCPEQFLRGLIHSDGCRSMNRIVNRRRSGTYQYSYPRYTFSQKSDQIRKMFTDTCDAMGIHWTTANARNIAVSRKTDVEFLDTFIGPKS